MTGLDLDKDVIIEIFCIITNGDLEVLDDEGWGCVVHQSKEVMDGMVCDSLFSGYIVWTMPRSMGFVLVELREPVESRWCLCTGCEALGRVIGTHGSLSSSTEAQTDQS